MLKITRAASGLLAACLLLTFTACRGTTDPASQPETSGASESTTGLTGEATLDPTAGTDASGTDTSASAEDPAPPGTGKTTSTAAKTTKGSTAATTTRAPDKKMDFSSIKGTTLKVHIGNEPTDKDKKLAEEFKKKYGCTVTYEVISWTEFQTKLVQAVNAKTPVDYIKFSDQDFINYAAKKIIQPIDDYIDINNQYFSKSFMERFKWKNQMYLMYDPANYTSSYGFIFYNKTMFEDEGETEPYDWYKQGKWDFEQFRKTARAMAKDTNKDGKMDILGFGTWWYEGLLLANGNSQVNINQNGTIDITLQNKSAYTAMQLIEDMQLVDHSFDWNTNATEMFLNSKLAMIFERPWEAVGAYDMYNPENFPDEIGFCPMPTGPDTGGKTYAPVLIHGYGIPTGAKNPLGAVAWFIFNAEYSKQHENDADVVKDRRRALSDEHRQIALDYIAKTTPLNSHVNSIGSWVTSKWEMWAGILRDNVPPATTVQTNINILKNEIQRTLGGSSNVIDD